MRVIVIVPVAMIVGMPVFMVMSMRVVMVARLLRLRCARADAFDMMMMAELRLADPGFETDYLLAIDTGQAIHFVIADRNAVEPVDKSVDNPLMRAEIAGFDEFDFGVCGGNLIDN